MLAGGGRRCLREGDRQPRTAGAQHQQQHLRSPFVNVAGLKL
jgi:hypothetical protein